MPNADRCVCCGEIIPEGRMVCPQCDQPDRHEPIRCDFCKPESVRVRRGLLDIGYGVYVPIRFCPICGREFDGVEYNENIKEQ